jgi:lipopolysaccharide transport protein LptA
MSQRRAGQMRWFIQQLLLVTASTLLMPSTRGLIYAELADDAEDLQENKGQKPRPPAASSLEPAASAGAQEPKDKEKSTKVINDQKSQPKPLKSRPAPAGRVKFWSKSLSGFRDQGSLSLEEDVVVTQDDIRIEADKATIFFQKTTNEAKEVHAIGSVRFHRIDPETGQPIRAEGREAVFDNTKRMVTMRGEPVLYRGEDVVRGKVIYYNLTTGWVKADRVEGVVQPAVKKTGAK